MESLSGENYHLLRQLFPIHGRPPYFSPPCRVRSFGTGLEHHGPVQETSSPLERQAIKNSMSEADKQGHSGLFWAIGPFFWGAQPQAPKGASEGDNSPLTVIPFTPRRLHRSRKTGFMKPLSLTQTNSPSSTVSHEGLSTSPDDRGPMLAPVTHGTTNWLQFNRGADSARLVRQGQ